MLQNYTAIIFKINLIDKKYCSEKQKSALYRTFDQKKKILNGHLIFNK